MHIKGFEEATWKEMLREAKARVVKPEHEIIASDISPAAVEAAKKNAEFAGVAGLVDFSVCDFRETKLPPPPGTIMLNPEYGFRLGDEAELAPVYRAIGDFFKQKCSGFMGHVFTGNLKLAREIGLRSKRRLTFFNGGLECRLLVFELYAGTRNP